MKAIGLFLLLLLSAFAVAFDDFDFHCADINLMRDRRLQDEIGITQKQRDRMNQFADANRKKLEAYQKELGTKQPDPNRLNSYLLELKTQVLSVMTPPQIKRLRELNLQAVGLMGPMDEVVATRMGMSKAEIERFRQTYIDGKKAADQIAQRQLLPIAQKYDKLAQPYKSNPQAHKADLEKLKREFETEVQPAKNRIEAIKKSTEQKMRALLTPKEKAAWLALQGRKYVPPKNK